jgi:acetyl esterase
VTGPDYDTLLDAEMRAYLARTDGFYPPDAVDLTIAEQRAVYDGMCAAFHAGRPLGVTVTDEGHGGVPCRRYETGEARATVVYFHGGGFVVGGLHSHDDVCAEICDRTGYRVVSVDYGLAPEVPFPGCFNDAWAATQAIAARWQGDLVLAGDSAGGNLAAAVAHHARGTGLAIAGQVLIYPSLGGDMSRGSYVTHADAPQLSTRDMAFYQKIRTGGLAIAKGDPRFAPLRDRDFSGLPATVIFTAECDPLSSDGEAYRDVLLDAGGNAIWIEEAGLVHGYLRARTMASKAGASFDRIVAALKALGAGTWPLRFS